MTAYDLSEHSSHSTILWFAGHVRGSPRAFSFSLFLRYNRRAMTTHDAPLAERMRPKNFGEFFGQESVVGDTGILRRLMDEDAVPSLIFWGPPGCGKTTLARMIAETSRAMFRQLSAVTSGIDVLRTMIADAKKLRDFNGQRTIIFLDEIHRWNKAQQDALLPHVEEGVVTLIGATTENPSFEVVAPLLSRCRVIPLAPLSYAALEHVVCRALDDTEHGLGGRGITMDDAARALCVELAYGDARAALNALETAARMEQCITAKIVKEVFQKPNLLYDKKGDQHYQIISAFIKSLRGSHVDAALYWCARMLSAGEEPLFIARRLVVLAAEDIGTADPHALVLATATMQAVHMIGMPEAKILLAEAVTYCACAPKSNASYMAILSAEQDVEAHGPLSVPLHLRNASTALMKNLGYGKEYIYTHDHPEKEQEFLPDELRGKKYYTKKL